MGMKKKLLAGVSYLAVATLAVGGTLAYLTDGDSQDNVSVIGEGVEIELIEQQRSEDGTELVEFEQGQILKPLVGSSQGIKDKWGLPSTTESENFIDKIVTVKNTGISDAYVRILVAMPKWTDGATTASSDNVVHWNFGNRVDLTGQGKYNEISATESSDMYFGDISYSAEGTVEIDGEEHLVFSLTYNEALKPGETTDWAAMAGFYLDSRVDCKDGKYYMGDYKIDYDLSQGLVIPVYAQAVQASDIKTAVEMFKEVTELTTNPWGGTTNVARVATADNVTDALAAGNDIIVTADVDLTPDEGEAITGNVITADSLVALNGNTLTYDVPYAAENGYNGTQYSALTAGSEEKAVDVVLAGGTIKATSPYAVYAYNGTVTIKDGTYIGQTSALQVCYADVVIEGGFYQCTAVDEEGKPTATFLLNQLDKNREISSITVKGGTFVNFNPMDNAAEGKGTNFVAEGYTVESETQANGDVWYTVVPVVAAE